MRRGQRGRGGKEEGGRGREEGVKEVRREERGKEGRKENPHTCGKARSSAFSTSAPVLSFFVATCAAVCSLQDGGRCTAK